MKTINYNPNIPSIAGVKANQKIEKLSESTLTFAVSQFLIRVVCRLIVLQLQLTIPYFSEVDYPLNQKWNVHRCD